MGIELSGWDWSAGNTTLLVVHESDRSSTPLERRLAEDGPFSTVETAAPAAVSEVLSTTTVAGVVHLPGDDVAESVASIAAAAPDCPVVVPGVDIDVAAVYAAGATDVIPLDPSERPEVVGERIVDIVGRHVEGRLAGALFDETGDGIVVHDPESGEIVGCNDRFYEMLGYDPATTELTLDHITDAEAGYSRARAVSLIRDAADGTPVQFEWSNPTSDGTTSRVEVKLDPTTVAGREFVVAFVRDVTERKARERELRIRERAMDNASIPLTLSDPRQDDDPLVYVNEAFTETTGYDAADALGRNCRFLQGEDTDPETVADIRAAIDAEETITTDIRNYRADGTPFWNHVEITPIYDADGSLLRYLGTQSDVTDRRREERVRERLLATTRELMRVDSTEAIADVVSSAAGSILESDLNAVYLTERGDDTPYLVEWSEAIDELFDGAPPMAGIGPITETFRGGDASIYDDLREVSDRAADEFAPLRSLLTLPLGDHGVLVVGATETGAFGSSDVEFGELLTVSATTALDRMQRIQELQEYETLFDTVQDKLYVIDRNGCIERVTDPLAEQVGTDPETLRGQHVSEILTDETVEEGERLILDLLVTPDSVSNVYEGTMVTTAGETVPVEIELSLLPHDDKFRGTVGTVRDISQRHQREQELDVLRRAITESGVGLTMYGDDGRFRYVNDHYAELLGDTRTAIESSAVWETFEHLTMETFETYWESFAEGETHTRQTEHRRRDGSTVPVETVTTAVTIDDDRYHVQTIQGITGQRERRQQTDALHRIIRHNLRNDLTVILGHGHRLIDRLSGENAASAETIVETADELTELVDTVQDAAEIIGRDTIRKPVDVVDMLRETVADLRADSAATIDVDLPDERYVYADTLLGIALEHVLTNAVEHNDAASPHVAVTLSSTTDRTGWITIEVADDGPGIPDHEQAVLTAGEETALRHGSGLGLWIIHWIVSRYGGELDFEENDPRGSRVRIALPVADTVPAADDKATADGRADGD
jgi:PAS domain S-box-containing protein